MKSDITIKANNTTQEINQKVLAKEGRVKRYRDRLKQLGQNRTFQKTKEILPASRGIMHKDIPTTG